MFKLIQFNSIQKIFIVSNQNEQSRGGAGLKGPARPPPGARQEEIVAVTPWPGAQTSCLRGGAKIVATLLSKKPALKCIFLPRPTYVLH